MIFSAFWGKWLLRVFPPFLFNRIWVTEINHDISYIKVKVSSSFINRNLNGSVFGGTIFSAADPFHAIMYWQIFGRRGIKVEAWLKSAQIRYLKPARNTFFLEFSISDQDLADATEAIHTTGKYVKTYTIEMKGEDGTVYAIAENEVYVRKIN